MKTIRKGKGVAAPEKRKKISRGEKALSREGKVGKGLRSKGNNCILERFF